MNSLRTEGHDLITTTTEFHVSDEKDEHFVQDLGLHVFDPEEVERNVEVQIERSLGLDPRDLLDKIRTETAATIHRKKETFQADLVSTALRIAKQDILRVRRDDFKRKDELLIKIKFLQDLLPVPVTKESVQTSLAINSASLTTSQPGQVQQAQTTLSTTTSSSSFANGNGNNTRSSSEIPANNKRIKREVATTTSSDKTKKSTSTTASATAHASSSAAATTTTSAAVMTCPSCNTYTTTSIRQLNIHLNSCLGKHQQENGDTQANVVIPRRRRTAQLNEDEGSSAEDDILDGEEGRGKKGKRKHAIDEDDDGDDGETTANIKGARLAVEDDWDPKYCKSRLDLFEKCNQAWINTWNSSLEEGLNEIDSHAKAEAAFNTVFDRGIDKEEGISASFSSSSDSDDSDIDEGVSNEPSPSPSELLLPEPRHEIIPNQLYCPQRLWNRLLPHQKETIPFLYQHHMHETGAILGDEMGLGKTAQAISFLACLKCSNSLFGPSLVIAPATTLSQWVSEFNDWYSPFRIFVLHESFRGKNESFRSGATKQRKKQSHLPPRTGPEAVSRAFDENEADIIITTYKGLQIHASSLLPKKWEYVVLDEAHIIRNPDIQVTLTCKQLSTPHRLALTGAPIQNRLRELWSLFDFIVPKRLGTLPTFDKLFAEPIRIGGMMGSNTVQVFQAFEAAKTLRATIIPFILQRQKKDLLASHALPEKTERVLFCKLTHYQREQYLKYLKTDQVNDLFYSRSSSSSAATTRAGQLNTGKVWRAISTLRKICNHPDLLDVADEDDNEEEPERDEDGALVFSTNLPFEKSKSAKMLLLDKILQEWRRQGHKVLVFCQGTQMLSVLERFTRDVCGYPTMRMDGSTDVKKRQLLISRFNFGPISNTFLFLLTTRVGGVGVNLTGATRVVIFDPDWNPSTDAQARERAWRLGQTKPVTVYRLIVSGTIEEKIYHRQIFKQFLTNKVLHDPSQRRFFKESDLRDLFTLQDEDGSNQNSSTQTAGRLTGVKTTDTAEMFHSDSDIEEEIKIDSKKKKKSKKHKRSNNTDQLPTDDEDEEEHDDDDDGKETDNVLLKSLFKAEDVFKEAFNHDLVETAARTQAEKLIAEKRAKQLAREARKQFMEEQKRLEHVPVNVPTFTGSAGPPPSAAVLLAAAQGANWGQEIQPPRTASSLSSSSAATAAATGHPSTTQSIYVKLLREIRNLLLKAGKNGCISAELMSLGKSELKNQVGGPELFRQLLREIAEFNDKKKKWFLKKKFH
jgi:SNF2 family DNA or RNA helicase